MLDRLLEPLQAQGLLQAGGRPRTDWTQILAAVRDLNRRERVGETLRAALNSVAVVAPDGLQILAPPVWYERYGRRIENDHWPKSAAARQALAATIGADGQFLLKAGDATTEHGWLGKVPAVQTLRRVWAEQSVEVDDPSGQARAGEGFAKADFQVDGDRQGVTGPAGHPSGSWLPKTTVPGVVVEARFSGQDCTPCPHRARCTRSKKEPRIIGLQPRDQYETLQATREVQTTEAFRQAVCGPCRG